mgnify:CR=1 FL=1
MQAATLDTASYPPTGQRATVAEWWQGDVLVCAALQYGLGQRVLAALLQAAGQAKKIAKIIRDEGPKGVKAQIQGDELRVSSKSRDDLQSVIAMLKDFEDADLQFVNFR